jgi:hypothetical protein
MGFVQRAADVAHKGALLGLTSVFAFQLYQLTTKAWGGLDKENPRSPTFSDSHNNTKEYVDEIREKAEDDYKNYWKTDHRDWYDKEDDSHLKNAPRVSSVKK